MGSHNQSDADKARHTEDGELTSKSAGEKSKGKAKDPGIVDHIENSGRLVFTALMANATAPELTGGSKSSFQSSRIRNASPFESPSESSSHSTRKFEPSGTMKTLRSGTESTQAFESFLAGAQASLPHEPGSKQLPSSTIAEQKHLDGRDMVELLSSPDHLDEPPEFTEDSSLCSPVELDQLREALFGSASQYPLLERLLDFSPDFLSNPEASREAEMHFGSVDPAATRSLWLQQWHDVFTSYNYQVWGDLGPLVAEARLEVDHVAAAGAAPAQAQGQPSGVLERPPATIALERLRQILIHVRESL